MFEKQLMETFRWGKSVNALNKQLYDISRPILQIQGSYKQFGPIQNNKSSILTENMLDLLLKKINIIYFITLTLQVPVPITPSVVIPWIPIIKSDSTFPDDTVNSN